jgi:hypothetical protein
MTTHVLYPLARHEALHVLHGELCGHRPESVYVTAQRCYTVLVYLLSPEGLPHHFAHNAHVASLRLAGIVGTILAGAVGEGCRVYGQDAAQLESWRDAYLRCGAELSDWLALQQAVEQTLARWARLPMVTQVVEHMAEMLCHSQRLSTRPAVETLLGAAGVQHVPLPQYTVQTPSAQRWGVRKAQAVERRPELRASVAPMTTNRLFTPEDEGWRWDERAQHGTGGWVR